MAEQEEMANQQQRKRLYQEVQLEKERLGGSFQQQQREMERRLATMEVNKKHLYCTYSSCYCSRRLAVQQWQS